ncbi:MAG: hypothetical protein H8E12_08885 [Rhodobacteraceae bacterium]|nr:hypothetical protein [Paracoccaceae bacterium]
MPIFSNNITSPLISDATETLSKNIAATISKSKSKKSQQSDEIAKQLTPSKKRCLAAAKIIERRLEILALLDYKPLFSGKNLTVGGNLFEARVTERNMDFESLLNIIETNVGSDTAALNKYNSAVVATQSDFAILKMLILLKEYATHTARFLDFINEYQPHEDLDISWLSDENFDLLSSVCKVKFDDISDSATTILIQLLLTVNCATYGISPYHIIAGKKNLPKNKIITKFNVTSNKSYIANAYDLAFISRDLTFSQEMTNLKNNDSPDEVLKELIDNALGSSFITSPLEQTVNIMRPFIGSTGFSDLRTSKQYQDELKYISIGSLLDNKGGVISKLNRGLTKESKPDILLPESGISSYDKEYSDIDPIVDKAFSGKKILDFNRYEKVIDDLVNELSDAAEFGKKAFRLLDEKENSAGKFREDIPIVAEEQPLSMPSISAVVLDVFNRRFASTVKTSLYNKFYDWKTPEHVSYTKVLAWLLIRDNPDIAKKIVRGFIKDYESGFLTVAAQPAPIEGSAELDDEGNEIEGTEEMSALAYVKPGTSTTVNLTGRSSSLNSQIKKLSNYYTDDVPQMSPATILSSNPAADVLWPPLRVQYNRIGADVAEYFGSSNHQETDPDLRLVNVMTVYRERFDSSEDGSTTSTSTANYWCGTKIVAAEVIDAVLEICRAMVTPFVEVEEPSDGDPVFPFVEDMKGPYGNGNWGYSADGYDLFQMNLWVSTVDTWDKLFTRTSDKKTYFRRRSIRTHSDKIIDILSRLMSPYDFLKVRIEKITDGIITDHKTSAAGLLTDYKYTIWPTCATVKYVPTGLISRSSWKADGDQQLAAYMGGISSTIDDLLNSSFDDIDNLQPVTASTGTVAVSSTAAAAAAATAAVLAAAAALTSSLTGTEVDVDMSLATISNEYKTFLSIAKRENTILSFLYDFIEKYGNRIENYKDATINLINDEASPIGELVQTLSDLGPAGEDILQNLSVNQLALKQVALEEEQGVKENGYLPNLSIISEKEVNCVRLLCSEEITKSPEGDTTKVIIVGIPISTFDEKKIDGKFGIRLSYRDVEYPQLVFVAKTFMFDKDLYILPDNLESITSTYSFSNIVKQAEYSKIRVDVVESTDESATIEIVDDIQKVKYDSNDPDTYVNLFASEVLKIYYRLMLGLNFSETAFPSTPEGAKIPISETSSGLAKAMSANIESISTFSAGLASNLDTLLNDITEFENIDDFVTGDITPVDAALLVDLKNAYQSRLFSSDVLRSRVLSAKMFDRIYAIPVDPDEFYIVPPGEAQVGDVETPAKIFNFYLDAGIIEETGLDSPRKYKLAPRKSAEGSMALGNITVSLVSASEDGDRIFDL